VEGWQGCGKGLGVRRDCSCDCRNGNGNVGEVEGGLDRGKGQERGRDCLPYESWKVCVQEILRSGGGGRFEAG